MEPMHITKSDVEYMQARLSEMMQGAAPRWNLRDRAVVSRLLIILNQCAEGRIVDVGAETAELSPEPWARKV